ncbi:telomere repeat-binding protein 4-like isoform X2 [Olea europaea var. sylvestris]|uniref:Telomere repeat-binding 3 isoform X1 n=1 Tax=Olea europaea subsp. europaea TaxID=158383 RepID=A0A8S0VIF7_OLEEU|nr:telomere repeat-binding protein 4-like isoform X2 [Olea europaea var. sylvestris]CAA3031939.1 telomere repeat-binding 3 isoform X1 [Olea europaea subsp. europaea]
MVSKKRQDYGFSGYRVPVIPRAPRSIRRRSPRKKLVEDSTISAFELLAAVAGKLLQESESSTSSNVAEVKVHPGFCRDGKKMRLPENDKALKLKYFDQGSCAESAFFPEISVQDRNILSNVKELPQAENDSILDHTSALVSCDLATRVDYDMKLEMCTDKSPNGTFPRKVDGGSNDVGDIYDPKMDNGPEKQLVNEQEQVGDLTMANESSVKDPFEECVNNNVLINSESSVQLSLYRDSIPGALFQNHRNDVKLGIIDDDENSFGCNKPCTKIRPFRLQLCNGYHRTRKMLTSKYRKVAPKIKDREFYNSNEGMKFFYRCRKNICKRERCHWVPIKKRKLFDHSFEVAYDQEASSESVYNLPEKKMRGDNSSSASIFHKESGFSASVKARQKSKDSKVKFSIKSFRVPELYIEVPETATVGSLKRMVMEAVTAILGSGLQVGVVLQGKKVRDDNRTLQQAGISQSSNLDSLGFALEPSFAHVSGQRAPKDLPLVLQCDAALLSSRSTASPIFDSGISNAALDPPLVMKLDNDIGNNQELIPSPKTTIDSLIDGVLPDSKALIPVPPTNIEALAVVPFNSKCKHTEISQRRTRRPFSVTEVEALVEAVEKLGTGRWRNVKMRAFEDADHRTYVDLKDKWKTLVHTASIAPQQRRGEPVPQEMLDRVLAAHAYWSQHQTKHGKHQVEPLQIIDSPREIVGA